MSFQSKVDEFVRMTTPEWATYQGDWRWLKDPNPPRAFLDPAFPGRDVTFWHHQHVFTATVSAQSPYTVTQLTTGKP